MRFWKRKEPIVQAPVSRAPSLFSTDIEDLPVKPRAEHYADAMGRTFQRDIFPAPMHRMGVGLDEAYSDLQLAKLQNNALNAGNLPWAQFSWYSQQGFIGWQAAAMLSQQWLIDKACSMPARDASRNGYEITVNDGKELSPEALDYIRKRDKEMMIPKNLVEFVRLGRVFGVRHAMFLVDSPDTEYYEKPFNIDGVRPGSYRGIAQIDPYWISPMLDVDAAANIASQHFYEPTWWLVNGRKIHRTHMVIMRVGDLPDILKPSYLYGGIPIPQKIAERVYAAEKTANEAPMLAMSKRMIIYKMDLSEAQAQIEVLQQKLEAWSALMNNFGIKVINGEGEEINQFDTTLTDLDSVIMTQFQLVSAASEVPVTKLLGTVPKGFNATGEYDESSYHEMLESIQQHDLSPLVNRHHMLLMKSEIESKFNVKATTEVKWKELDPLTTEEQADVNLKKAQADQIHVANGALDGFDVRQRLIVDPDSGYNGIAEIVPDGPGDRDAIAEEKAAQEDMAGEGED